MNKFLIKTEVGTIQTINYDKTQVAKVKRHALGVLTYNKEGAAEEARRALQSWKDYFRDTRKNVHIVEA